MFTLNVLYSSSKRNMIFLCWRCDMDYMTLKQTSEKWGISPLMINYYCSEGRIVGAEKTADKRYKDCRGHSSRKDNKHE